MTMKMAEVLSHLYPDSLRRVLLVRAPTPFQTIWTIVSPLIDEKTRLKVYLYSGQEVVQNLTNYLDKEAIPTFLGKTLKKKFKTNSQFTKKNVNYIIL